MKKVILVVMFVCFAAIVTAQPVLAARAEKASSSEVVNLVNVNDADLTALTTLQGIGQVTAERIVAY